MAKKTEWLWFVACEGHVTAPVIAESWEQATVEAAKFWGVRWGAVAAACELQEKRPVVKNVCAISAARTSTAAAWCATTAAVRQRSRSAAHRRRGGTISGGCTPRYR